MNPILNIAIRAIRAGGKIIAQNYDLKNISCDIEKKKNFKYIKRIKRKTFSIINNLIKQSYPRHYILNIDSKEKIQTNKNIWIINTLNGKKNFIQKIPHFCLSIIIQEKNQTYISVIYDPIKNDLFTAIKGQGAQLNGFRTRCYKYNKNIYNTIITLYYKNKHEKNINLYISLMQQLLKEKISIRQSGCSILDLAYLSSGKINAYVSFNEKKSNFFFGELQIKESGALITDILGGHNYIKNKTICVGYSNILKFILKKTRFLSKIYKKKLFYKN
ncbi:inositol monophosphatase family protein [Buchnera aphidicola]|uniref:Inositol monophosphatase n=1 Tax=Buchnera aphidicola subsp. Cinara cedri (strain Cc) TaxID=372461 RepID=Q057Q2_BUCCC|nr:inositol monophosphatase family protein [Buchnera aphidicola]ABJ90647.1 inositol monophosphatase [Buchnera aphidicola BCc]